MSRAFEVRRIHRGQHLLELRRLEQLAADEGAEEAIEVGGRTDHLALGPAERRILFGDAVSLPSGLVL
ncbi:hypothetical protein [Streptomyces sp. SID13031]|uniref:hypothetical protein n=1 Tax=Streptomyces sp. SID13031 TaxID=2706046 RepID=UPI0013C8A2CA|nr:hypothetical protein [Streptomyces sp. SID13031]NEA36846.1 hypothetical protein [Streptomyces sp. SID13031]